MDKCGFCPGGIVVDKVCVSCGTHYPCRRNYRAEIVIRNRSDQFDEMSENQWQAFLEKGGFLYGEDYRFA